MQLKTLIIILLALSGQVPQSSFGPRCRIQFFFQLPKFLWTVWNWAPWTF